MIRHGPQNAGFRNVISARKKRGGFLLIAHLYISVTIQNPSKESERAVVKSGQDEY